MQDFTQGLFDRMDGADLPRPRQRHGQRERAIDDAMRSVTRDLQALLNTRSALHPSSLAPYKAVSDSIVNYGLVDFAAMCMNSHADQQQICQAVLRAIQRHEPRLEKVTVTLCPGRSAINRIDFVIMANLRYAPGAGPMSFTAVFRPSVQQYSIEDSH